MNRKSRLGLLLALMLLIAACTDGTEPSTEAPQETTATTSSATTDPSTTTSLESSARTVTRPWGYHPDDRAVELSVIVPADWETQGDVNITGDDADGTFMRVGAGIIGNVFADRCQWRTTNLDPPLGPTVEDLTTALSTIWGSDATVPVDVVVDGFDGQYMVLTVPADADFTDCDDQHYVGWAEAGVPDSSGPSRWYQGPGQILEHWILDVDGVRLVIEASHFPELSNEGLAELQGIVDSIEIVTD